MTERDKRNVVIIGTVAIAINVLEALIVPNVVEQKFDKNWKLKLPVFSAFASALLILSVTSMLGGYVSNKIMLAMEKQGADDNNIGNGQVAVNE